jgi:cytochrome c2
MRSSDGTFYNLKRLHLVFAASALALLAATLWALVRDQRREWKVYQSAFRDQVEPGTAEARRPLSVEQVWLPDLTINYHFRQVARFDRCVTCHQGMAKTPGPISPPHPYRAHPRLDLFVGSRSPHPLADFGCTICHDGQGSATEFKFASHSPDDPVQGDQWRREHGWFWNRDWDLPMRPKRFLQSGCMRCHCDVSDLEPSDRFPDPPAPKLLAGYHLVRRHGCYGCHEIKSANASGKRIGPDLSTEPKVGPSLREVRGKLGVAFLERWIADPAAFRPLARMPRLFGLDEHLEGESLARTKRLERAEIQAVAAYLVAASRPVDLLPRPREVSEPPSPERGRQLFRTQGCLACHRHADYPAAQSTQGPDLSRLGVKLSTSAGRAWLADWIRDPARHSARTLMPNPRLAPVALTPAVAAGGQGKTEGKKRWTDPAADLAAFLLDADGPQPPSPLPPAAADLDELVLSHLVKMFPREEAERYLAEGVPASAAGRAPPDADELLAPVTPDKKLRFVGRRTIRKRGCFGCHEIQGLEAALPIGPALSDWGRKQESLLAFEQVYRFALGSGSGAGRRADGAAEDADRGFYLDALRANRREGFLWQKLRAPRSFDYQKAGSNGFDGQLLMGRFALSDTQREEIATFVLGLVAEPPGAKYAAQLDPQRRAIVAGRRVLDRYGCAGCHTLALERWSIEYDPRRLVAPALGPEFDVLKQTVSDAALASSQKTDRRGLARADLAGMPQFNSEGKMEETEDDNGNPQCGFTLWEPAAIAGRVWPVGGASVLVSPGQIVARRAPWGGDFARLLYPVAVAEARASGSTATVLEAWGWGPPPLVHEGRQVRPAWLHDYLMDPYVIRPTAVLRMPKFNLSADEAGGLVEYFAALAGEESHYAFDPRSRGARLEAIQADPPKSMAAALRLLTDRTTYCAKCHLIGDYRPEGENRTILAPNLDRVGRRLRPEHLRRWLVNPRSVLPYTAMPVNFPPERRMGQEIYPGESLEQLDAVMDLLLNYDGLMNRRTSIRHLMEPPNGR